MRLVLFIWLLTAALKADPITVIQTSSTFGLTDLFYSYDVPTSGPVTAFIRGDASCPNAAPTCNQPATATIDFSMDLYTPGPIKDGIAMLQLILSDDGIAAGAARVSGDIGPYSLGSCPKGLTCQLGGYFPFELGVPFTIDLSGLANGGAGFLVSASLQLFEAPTQAGDPVGAPVHIYLVPEPSLAVLTVTGIFALLLFAFIRRRKRPL